MELQPFINQLVNPADDTQAIEAARALETFTDDARVMDALCTAAVRTDNYKLRETLIEVLKTNPAGASIRFSDNALWSQNPTVRKWALVNLCLMRCRDAKDAVISGLYDVDASVRKAAAMNTGLYNDTDVQGALELYFANYQLDLTLSLIADGLNNPANGTTHRGDDDISTTTILI